MTRVYRIKRRYNHITEKDLILLHDTLSQILDGYTPVQQGLDTSKLIGQLIKEEQQRHRQALKEISRILDEKGKN